VVLVTSREQDTARNRWGAVQRPCMDHGATVLSELPYQVVYEWGALFKSLALQSSLGPGQPRTEGRTARAYPRGLMAGRTGRPRSTVETPSSSARR
jgi:hypothetical protein